MLQLIDHADSFSHLLAAAFRSAGEHPTILRYDELTLTATPGATREPSILVFSPGPGHPDEYPRSVELIRRSVGKVPILGVCLGHQLLASVLGGRIIRSSIPRHGHASPIEHSGEHIFRGVPSPTLGARYHSLCVDTESLPKNVEVYATADDGCTMALGISEQCAYGIQFHPESHLSSHGDRLIENFLRIASTWLHSTSQTGS